VSTAGTVCDGSVISASNPSSIPTVGNFINTGPVPTAEQTFTAASGVEFTVDMIKKFEKRFENGYNIYTNQTYVQWLRMHHPDHRLEYQISIKFVYFALYTEILEPHDDLGSVSSAAVSTAGTVCDGSAGNFPNTGPVVRGLSLVLLFLKIMSLLDRSRTKGKICKGEDYKEQHSKYPILQKPVFSIVSCQKMNVLFVLKRIQSQLSS